MINLTPYKVTVRAEDGTENIYPPSGKIAKIEIVSSEQDSAPDGCPCCEVIYGKIELPIEIPEGYSIQECYDVVRYLYKNVFVKNEPTGGFIEHINCANNRFIVSYVSKTGESYKVSTDDDETICQDIKGDVIVSELFVQQLLEDEDLYPYVNFYSPDYVFPVIRENGQIVAVRRLLKR